MHFHNQTVFKSVSSLNQDYFLPALQREFVWDQGQVLRLFDSLLQGYPIGSFLFWEPPSSSTGGQTYAFVYEARARVHNPPAPVSARRPVLVLDGQQRLTSLLIGLRGSLADKPKFTRKHLERNWTKRFLHLDLFTGLSFKTEDDVDGAVGDLHYRLRFWSETPAASTTSCWFKVSEIYSRKNPRSLRTLIRTMVRRLPRKCKARHHRAVETNLRRLHEVVFHDKSISYHLEDGSDADRVLNIFVRANEGGTELSRADLLMSTVTQRWDKLDAREEIRGLVDDLNNDISDDGRGPFSTDFVLK